MTITSVTSGIIARFQNLFRPRETQLNPVTLVEPPPRPSAMMRLFTAENDRRSRVLDCQRMVDEDTRADGVINALARDTVKAGFELRVSGPRAKEAKQIADDLLKRLKVTKRIEQWVRVTLRDGDSFFELATNRAGLIVEMSRKPTLELHRHSDDFDQFYDPSKAFFWTDQSWNGVDPPNNAVFFAEWQIIHARFKHDENQRYGRPLFASARKAYKRMSEGELDISIRRKTRAGMKYVHALEDATEADIELYKARNKSVLSDPFSAISDFFSGKKTTITAVQGDANLQEIGDVEHHMQTWAIASPVPLSLLGYGHDLNRDILGEQKEQYDSTKESIGDWASEEIILPLVTRQLLLMGIWPDSLEIAVEWAAKDGLTPDVLLKAAQAFNQLNASGKLTDPDLLRLLGRFIPDWDAEAAIAALEKAQAEEMKNELARIAANADLAAAQAEKAKADAAAQAAAQAGGPVNDKGQPVEEIGNPLPGTIQPSTTKPKGLPVTTAKTNGKG